MGAVAAAVLAAALMVPPAQAAMERRVQSEPIVVYDLSHTLRLDLRAEAACRQAWDTCHLVASLQGLVNRKRARLYLRYLPADDFWWEKLRRPGEWLAGRPVEQIDRLEALLERFRGDYRGVVVYDERVPATSNLASTIAGLENLLCIRYDPGPNSLYTRLVQGGPRLPVKRRLIAPDGGPLFTGRGTIPDTSLPSTGSAKGDAYTWARVHFLEGSGKGPRCNPTRLAYYLDAYWLRQPLASVPSHHTLTNHDFFISRKAFFFDLSPWEDESPVDDPEQPAGTDAAILKAVLRAAHQASGGRMIHVGGFVPWAYKYTNYGVAGGKHEPVPSEWHYAETLSAYNAFMDADAIGLGAMANASFFQHYPLKPQYPQQARPDAAALQARGFLDAEGRVAPRHYYAFYVGDYDSAAWLYQMLPRLWDHPDRGKVPLSWAFNPNLADRMAPALVYTRETASPLDRFVSGDSGAGYINPGLLEPPRVWSDLPSGSETWREHCLPYFRRWDLSVTGFVIDGYAPAMTKPVLDAYAAFSPGGIVAQKVPPLSLHGEMPVLRMDYDLTQTPPESARVLLSRLGGDLSGPPEAPTFHVFRAILKTPAWYRELMEAAHAAQPEAAVEFVDLPTLLALAKAHLKAELPRAEGRASRSGSGGTG